MEKIRKWLAREGFSLHIKPGICEVCCEEKIVTINENEIPASKIISALHECGHIAIWKCRVRNPRRKLCGSTLGASNRLLNKVDSKMSRTERIAVVEEEIEAWNRGERLAKRLKIRVNKKLFMSGRTKALMTYQRWCVL